MDENSALTQTTHETHGKRFFYLTDYMTAILCVFFAIVRFATVGLDNARFGNLSIDRGLAWGVLFLIGAALIWVMAKLLNPVRNSLATWFRLFYVQLYYLIFFQNCIMLSNIIYRGRSLDGLLASWEESIFGFQPALEFYPIFQNNPFVTEVLFFSYFSFYLLFTIGIWLLFIRGKRKAARVTHNIVTAGFYLLYIVYVFLPVQGPKYYFSSLNELWYQNFQGFIFTTFLTDAFGQITLAGAAFPSSHAAIAVLVVLMSLKYQRAVGIIFILLATLILTSAVYIYAHYVIDILAGIVLGFVYYKVLPKFVEALKNLFIDLDSRIGPILKIKAL